MADNCHIESIAPVASPDADKLQARKTSGIPENVTDSLVAAVSPTKPPRRKPVAKASARPTKDVDPLLCERRKEAGQDCGVGGHNRTAVSGKPCCREYAKLLKARNNKMPDTYEFAL